jgi:hypothetical protein
MPAVPHESVSAPRSLRPLRRCGAALSLVLALGLAVGCVQIGLPGENEGDAGAAGTAGSAGAAGASAVAPGCSGFFDILARCGDLSCLQTATCDPAKAGTDCPVSASGPASCFAGRCAYRQSANACTTPADCGCGLCGADGRCYSADAGTCGLCETPSSVNTPAEKPLPCKTCLADCQGTGPSCCSGCGCVCEGVCGVCY